MPGQLLSAASALFLLAPWCVLTSALLPQVSAVERLGVGAAAGLAASVTAAHVLGMAQHLDAFVWVYAAAWLVTVGCWLHRRRAVSVQPLAAAPYRLWLWLGLALVVAFELVPTLASRAPIGWDPAFHAILAEKIRLQHGLVYDWQPFESIPLNYPLGSHLWIVLNAMLARQPVHHVFQVEHLVLQTIACLLVFALTLRIFDCWRSALFALLAYGLLGDWGTFYSYYQWGGLPTELSFVLFLGVVWVVLALDGPFAHALGVLLYGSIVLVHHLSAMIATLVLGGYVVLALLTRARDGLWQRIAWIGGGTALAYAWFVVPYALRASHLQGTQVLQFAEEHRLSLLDLLWNLSVLVVASGALGLWRARAAPGAGVTFLFAWTALLLLGYFGLDYVYRLVALLRTGRDFTAFTASRMATVLSYPLCIAGGYGIEQLRAWLAARIAQRQPAGARYTPEQLSIALLVVAAALLAGPRALTLAQRRAYEPVAESAGAWLREHTPADAFILYRQPIAPRRWVPFLTWRSSAYSPIPASEDRAAVEAKYRELLSDPNLLSQRLARYGKHAWSFDVAPDGSPKLTKLP